MQRSSKAMSFLGFFLECCVRDDAEVSLPGGKLLIREFLRIPLHPSEQLVEPPYMLHLRIVVLSLERHNKHHHIDSGVRSIRNRSKERDEELMQRWYTLLLICPRGKLRMLDGAQFRHKIYLVERDLSSDRILNVLHATISERASLDRQLAKFLLKHLQQFLHYLVSACDLEVVNMDRHDKDQHSFLVPKAKLIVNAALTHSTLLGEDAN